MSEKQVKTTELCSLTVLSVALMKGCVTSSAKKQRRGTNDSHPSDSSSGPLELTLNKASREEKLEL